MSAVTFYPFFIQLTSKKVYEKYDHYAVYADN